VVTKKPRVAKKRKLKKKKSLHGTYSINVTSKAGKGCVRKKKKLRE